MKPTNPIWLNSASNHAKQDVIRWSNYGGLNTTFQLNGKGGVKIEYTYQNVAQTDYYTLEEGLTLFVDIDADDECDIYIIGQVTKFTNVYHNFKAFSADSKSLTSVFLSNNGSNVPADLDVTHCLNLQQLIIGGCPLIETLNLSKNSKLEALGLSGLSSLQSVIFIDGVGLRNIINIYMTMDYSIDGDLNPNTIEALVYQNCNGLDRTGFEDLPNLRYADLRHCPDLTWITFENCPAISELILRDNQNLWSIDIAGCENIASIELAQLPKLDEIKARVNNQAVANEIISAINASQAADGRIWLNPTDVYYNNVATTATDKGWTIYQLT